MSLTVAATAAKNEFHNSRPRTVFTTSVGGTRWAAAPLPANRIPIASWAEARGDHGHSDHEVAHVDQRVHGDAQHLAVNPRPVA